MIRFQVYRLKNGRLVRVRHVERELSGLSDIEAATLLPVIARRYRDPLQLLREVVPLRELTPFVWIERSHAARPDERAFDTVKTRTLLRKIATYEASPATVQAWVRSLNLRARTANYTLHVAADAESQARARLWGLL